MDISQELRYFCQIVVRYSEHLREMSHSPSFQTYARWCAELRGDDRHFRDAACRAYDGITRPEFDRVEQPRRAYHEQKQAEFASRLDDYVFQLALGDRHRLNIRLSALDDETTRTLLCKAVHDTTDWQYQSPEDVGEEDEVTFKVRRLESPEIETMTRLALHAAQHQVRLDVLEEVRCQVNGNDWYEAPSRPGGSPSPAVQEVLRDAGGRGRPDLQGDALREPSPPVDAADLEDELSAMADTLELVYDEVEGAGEQRYIGAPEVGEMLGLTRKTVLNRSNLPEDNDRHIPSLNVAGSNRKRFDRKVIKRLMKASGR